ncbi:RRXRR domain-containing protein [Moorena producens]|uniref:RRXRR domain-containing protein n=1 Tax=Moorena producens TaxID=1155739 RepID=UPI003C73EAA6
MQRVSVISSIGQPLMPTKASRARRWLREGKAIIYQNPLNVFTVQLVNEPSGYETQPIAVGIDPGKMFSGIAVQSAKATIWTGHLVLPYPKVRDRMETRRMMRRTRRSRRINRKVVFDNRAHRQKRFDNRVSKKLPPSIKANRDLEFRVVSEFFKFYPLNYIVYEVVKAKGTKAFSPAMVGQYQSIKRLEELYSIPVLQKMGWETSSARKGLGLAKDKTDKSRQTVETHANDGIALASFPFRKVKTKYFRNGKTVTPTIAKVTPAPFAVVSRPPISRSQLHLLQFAKGGKRRKYGGTTTRYGFRKGDYVEAVKAGKTYQGWVSGDTKTQVSVSDCNWKRIGQFTARKVRLLKRSTGLIVNNK